MADNHLSGKLAVILHADVADSTTLVQQDEHLAHERIQDAFRRFGDVITKHHGYVRELRGDALLAEFERASDAVTAALEFQIAHNDHNSKINGNIRPAIRVGIALGEVVIADNTVTGAGVVLAQRVEQLAEPGGVCITGATSEALPQRLPYVQEDVGEQRLKGFDKPVHVYRVTVKPDELIPLPQKNHQLESPLRNWRVIIAVSIVLLAVAGGVMVLFKPWVPQEELASVDHLAFPLPDQPSIAVLPFTNIGGDPEQEYFSDGITNDLITDLSKFTNLFVVASNSTFAYKGKSVKIQQVAEDLGVQYVIEGSVQRAGDTIRINTQLIDALSGHHVWAERYDRNAEDLFAIQVDLINTIVGSLHHQVDYEENRRALKRPTKNFEAYDYYQRGTAYRRSHGRENNAKALEQFEKSTELDPQYARAYADLGLHHSYNYQFGWIEDTSESLATALKYARMAVSLDPDDYWNSWALGHVYVQTGQSDLARSAYNRALELNPNDPTLLMEMVEFLISIGQSEQAVAQAMRAIRWNPGHPQWYFWNLGWAQYFDEQYADAIASLQKISEPSNGVRRTLAAILVRLGRTEEAKEVMKAFMKNDTIYSIDTLKSSKYSYRPFIDKWVQDLRIAGLREHSPATNTE